MSQISIKLLTYYEYILDFSTKVDKTKIFSNRYQDSKHSLLEKFVADSPILSLIHCVSLTVNIDVKIYIDLVWCFVIRFCTFQILFIRRPDTGI